jgi:PadR family transcriptional regulator PadR
MVDVYPGPLVAQMRRGTLQYCILALLSTEERYGFDLVRALATVDGMVTSEGTIYPLLGRLRRDGLVETTWRESPSGPPRRYYRLTRAGRAALDAVRRRVGPLPRRRRLLHRTKGALMTTKTDPVDEYLRDLDRRWRRSRATADARSSTRSRSTSRRGEAELEPDDEAGLRTLLDRLGEPEQIAAEARDRYGVPTRERSWVEVAAIVLLLVGGFLAGIGWIVGVVLLWLSSIWTLTDKLIGTLIVPGGLAMAGYLFFAVGTEQSCEGEVGGAMTCTPDPPASESVLRIVLFILVLIAPIFTAIYLARRSKRLAA